MAATLFTLKIADEDIRGRIQKIIEAETVSLSSDYELSVIDDQKNHQWKLRIKRPDGTDVSTMVDGALGEHQPSKFRIRLRELISIP